MPRGLKNDPQIWTLARDLRLPAKDDPLDAILAYCANWALALLKENLIAPGEVDERSINDVLPSDLAGFTQCHFFAGVGIWSYALRLAGWPDDREVWTGSCPCQPFSVAGKGEGFADERHLWPAWHWLVAQRAPGIVFGEQVARLDLVQTDLEGLDYTAGAVVLPAAGLGAPHGRHRIFFVAQSQHYGHHRPAGNAAQSRSNRQTGYLTEALASYASPWVSPSSRDWKDTTGMATTGINPDGSERTRLDQLPRQAALANWSTSTGEDSLCAGKRISGPGFTIKRSWHIGKHRQCRMAGARARWKRFQRRAKVNGTERQVDNQDLARLMVSGPPPTGSIAETKSIGQLNPAHSRWLMGLPPAWCACAVTAMASLPRLPRRSSKRISK